MTAAIRATTGNVMADPPVSNKLKKFEVGPTIPVGRLNALVNHANRPPQMGAGGLQRTRSPGGGDMYNVPYHGDVLFAELNDDFEEGDRLRKGAGLLVDDGTGQTTEFTKLDHEYEPVMSCGVTDVHLTGEQQFLTYNQPARHWLPMRGVQIHQGKCTDTGDITEFGSGNFNVYRDGDHLDAANGDTTIIVQAQDWAGYGCIEGTDVMLWQTLHDRKWYFLDPTWYCGKSFGPNGTTVLATETELVFSGGNTGSVNNSKTLKGFGNTNGAIHGATNGALTVQNRPNQTGLMIAHINAGVSFAASKWCDMRVALQLSTDSGSNWGDIAVATFTMGTALEDIVFAEHGGSIASRLACCSVHAAEFLDPETSVRRIRLMAQKTANTSAVVTNTGGHIRIHYAFPGDPNDSAS